MERVHVKSCFYVYVPLESNGNVNTTPDLTSGFGFSFVDKLQGLITFTIKIFCKHRLSSKEYEQQDCLTWAKQWPITNQKQNSGQQRAGLVLRLKVKQGAFDFRKVEKRFIRLQIDCHNSSGQLLNTASSEFFQLLPRKRKADIISLANKEGKNGIFKNYWTILFCRDLIIFYF